MDGTSVSGPESRSSSESVHALFTDGNYQTYNLRASRSGNPTTSSAQSTDIESLETAADYSQSDLENGDFRAESARVAGGLFTRPLSEQDVTIDSPDDLLHDLSMDAAMTRSSIGPFQYGVSLDLEGPHSESQLGDVTATPESVPSLQTDDEDMFDLSDLELDSAASMSGDSDLDGESIDDVAGDTKVENGEFDGDHPMVKWLSSDTDPWSVPKVLSGGKHH
ncbi:hypothetical protein LTR86_009696 [Recurvomyces mirabilis]|nr:hypothetical protein LTR86_009696 [Recurvomyces mirabilis]